METRVAIIGASRSRKVNALNMLTGRSRAIVSPIGRGIHAIVGRIDPEGRAKRTRSLITARVRRKGKPHLMAEKEKRNYPWNGAAKTWRPPDVAMLGIDAVAGAVTGMDATIGGYARSEISHCPSTNGTLVGRDG